MKSFVSSKFAFTALCLSTLFCSASGNLSARAADKGEAKGEAKAEAACHARGEKDKPTPVRAEVHIAAPPHLVWNVVHEERKHDPDMAYSKVLSEKDNEVMLEQKFTLLPVIGTSVCTMQQKETPGQRIDYKLVKSDRFKVMEGSWVLTPSADNKSTTLTLTTALDLGIPVPRTMFNHVCVKKVERRLQHIKEMAEEEAKAARVAELKKSI